MFLETLYMERIMFASFATNIISLTQRPAHCQKVKTALIPPNNKTKIKINST